MPLKVSNILINANSIKILWLEMLMKSLFYSLNFPDPT